MVTGGIKMAAHTWFLPAGLMGVVTPLHDWFGFALVVLVAIHVLVGSLAPWAWPLLKSMITGYMSEEYVQKNHALWYRQIKEGWGQ